MPQQLVDILDSTDADWLCDNTDDCRDGDDDDCPFYQCIEEDMEVDNILNIITDGIADVCRAMILLRPSKQLPAYSLQLYICLFFTVFISM